MRRVLIIPCVYLLLGLLTTVGAAWACAAWVNPMAGTSAHSQHRFETGEWELHSTFSNSGHARINRVVGPAKSSNDGANLIAHFVQFPDGSTTGLLKVIGSEDRAGWPLHALWSLNPDDVYVEPNPGGGGSGPGGFLSLRTGQDRIDGGIKLKPWTGARAATWRALPYQPIWRGLILNTLFYAAIWFILIFGPLVIRKIWRRHHQQCVRCGYDLRGAEHTLCPECGVTVP